MREYPTVGSKSRTGRATGKPNAAYNRIRVLHALIQNPDGDTASRLCAFAKLPGGQGDRWFEELVASGHVERIAVRKPAGAHRFRDYPGARRLMGTD